MADIHHSHHRKDGIWNTNNNEERQQIREFKTFMLMFLMWLKESLTRSEREKGDQNNKNHRITTKKSHKEALDEALAKRRRKLEEEDNN
ncbi:25232_t:CDS:2 [Gigaspora rosea]|nr:25232_t:CDS:2 [Gigaspora rosea]